MKPNARGGGRREDGPAPAEETPRMKPDARGEEKARMKPNAPAEETPRAERGVIFLNGEPYRGAMDCAGAFTVCCDGALRWAEGRAHIDVKAGDFDSLGFVPEGALTYPAEKNFTDGEIALELLLGRGCTRIDIYGAGGGREDHLFGNLQLLLAGFRRGAFTVMHTNYVDAYCARGQVCWRGLRGRTLSLAPAGERAHIIESEGLKYPLCDLTLRAGSCRGISNVIAADEARILCDAGTLFVFEVREEATW